MNDITKILLITLTVIILGAGLFYLLQGNTPQEVPTGDENRNAGDPDSPANWTRVEASEFGFSFAYPEEWGQAELQENAGMEAGTKATIEFSNFNGLVIGGISDNFAEGREGIPTDTQGFEKEGDDYSFKFVGTSTRSIEIVESVQTELGEAVLVNHRSFVGDEEPLGPALTVGPDNLGALVNLQDSPEYSGVMFWVTQTDQFSEEMLKDMLDSIRTL